jgi:flagellar L-ring protein precursor FlgH
MLMRVQETVDYNHVAAHHEAIHARLVNWRRWVTVRPHGWATAPMFRMYQSKSRQWHAPDIQDGMKGDYVYEGAKDDSFVIRSHPDKKIVDEMRGFTADRSVAHRQNGKSKSTAKIIGSMSVLVTAVDPTTGLLTLAGTRDVGFDNAKNSLKLSGQISPLDVRDDKTVMSDMVANLKIEYSTAPTKENLSDPDIKLKTKKNANGTETIQKAELSNDEKQAIILKNMKRLLGESQ